MAPRLQEVVINCADPSHLAEFWGRMLGARWALMDPDWAVVDADPMLIGFQRVPDPKGAPHNRLHLDIQVDDAEAWAQRAEGLGARRLGPAHLGPDGDGSVVLADPADNEFCFVVDNHGRWTAAARAALDAAGPR